MARKTITESGEATAPVLFGSGGALDRIAFEESVLALMTGIPEAGEDDDISVYAQMMQAETVEDLEVGGHLPAGRDLIGHTLKVGSMIRRVSDLDDPDSDARFRLPYYLVIQSVNTKTGEGVRWQTSSPGLVLPLAKLHQWGKLPAVITIVETGKEKAGKSRALGCTIDAASPGPNE